MYRYVHNLLTEFMIMALSSMFAPHYWKRRLSVDDNGYIALCNPNFAYLDIDIDGNTVALYVESAIDQTMTGRTSRTSSFNTCVELNNDNEYYAYQPSCCM